METVAYKKIEEELLSNKNAASALGNGCFLAGTLLAIGNLQKALVDATGPDQVSDNINRVARRALLLFAHTHGTKEALNFAKSRSHWGNFSSEEIRKNWKEIAAGALSKILVEIAKGVEKGEIRMDLIRPVFNLYALTGGVK